MSTPAVKLPYVGRAQELDVLSEAVRKAARGTPTVVFVEGEPGIGKSRFVEEVVRDAAAEGFRPLVGAAEELERTRPFAAIRRAFGVEASGTDGDLVSAARVLEESASVHGWGEGRYRIVEDILELVEKLSTSAPVIVALEDLHWADPSSLLTLYSLGRRRPYLPLLLIATYRASPMSVELARVVDALTSQGALRLRLDPLDDAEVASLAGAILGSSPGTSASRVMARAGGNPLLVIELARALAQGQGAGDAEAGEGAWLLPPALRSKVLGQLAHVPSRVREALQVAAVLGCSFDVSHLAVVMNRSPVYLLAVLEDARRAGTVGDAGLRLAFRHDLVRDAIYEDIGPSMRQALHLEAARALIRSGVPVVDVADHIVLGATKGDRQAVEWLRQAAQEAAPSAPAVAVDLLERALELVEESDGIRGSLVADLLEPLHAAGRTAEAEQLARRALGQSHSPPVKDRLQLGLVRALAAQDNSDEHLRESLIRYEGMSSATASHLKVEAARALIHLGRMDEAAVTASEALEAAERHGGALEISWAVWLLSAIATHQGRLSDAVSLARRSVALHRSTTPRPNVQGLAYALTNSDRLDEAATLLHEARLASVEAGDVAMQVIYHWRLLNLHFLNGAWDDAIAEGEAGLALSEETGFHSAMFQGCSVLAEMAIHRNELERAEAYLARAETELGRSEGHRLIAFLPRARGLLAEAQGDQHRALGALEMAWETARETGAIRSYTEIGPDLLRVLSAIGEGVSGRGVVRDVEESARRQNTASARGAAIRCRGMAVGDPDLLLGAVAVTRQSPRVLDRARACDDAGLALAATARRAEGLALLEEALLLYERLGARHRVRAVESALRHAGVTRGRRGTRRRPATGWEALTKTELEVVELVGQGFTARETGSRLFISPRTVETHVAHVFAKLGLSSRAQLREALSRRATDTSADSPA